MFDREVRDDAQSGKMLAIGLLVGAVLGAGAALLLAPASGAETRRTLRRGAQRAYRRGEEVVEETLHDAERMARRAAHVAARRARREVHRARDAAEVFVDDARRSLVGR